MTCCLFTSLPTLPTLLSSQKRPTPAKNWAPQEQKHPVDRWVILVSWTGHAKALKKRRLTEKPATQRLGICRKCLSTLHQFKHACVSIRMGMHLQSYLPRIGLLRTQRADPPQMVW